MVIFFGNLNELTNIRTGWAALVHYFNRDRRGFSVGQRVLVVVVVFVVISFFFEKELAVAVVSTFEVIKCH